VLILKPVGSFGGGIPVPTDNSVVKFFRLALLRPIERFLAQWISVNTEPSAFVKERIVLIFNCCSIHASCRMRPFLSAFERYHASV
jgi:hypothetical protein